MFCLKSFNPLFPVFLNEFIKWELFYFERIKLSFVIVPGRLANISSIFVSVSAPSSLATSSAYFYIMSYTIYFVSYQQFKKHCLTYHITIQCIIIQIMVSYNVLTTGPHWKVS